MVFYDFINLLWENYDLNINEQLVINLKVANEIVILSNTAAELITILE